uniref:Uncharacterized protein n=1 Tax=Tanacetum cinerariifolium TaxID=118510 RepID=A0A6L2JDJ1_TANCI|nr:hypothetical protein [Tanacetum cinerariifolium]
MKIKKEQAEVKQTSKYTIKSIDKATIDEYDKRALSFGQCMRTKPTIEMLPTYNKNVANYKLYHALMEALLDDEEAMDKEVADTAKDHKKKHDGDDSTVPTKGFKTGKSASAKEPVEEPIAEVIMDEATNTKGEDVIHNEYDQPHDSSEPKTDRQSWFKQSPRPPTLDAEWNKHQYVLNRLKIDNLTQDILIGHAFNLLKEDRYPYDLTKTLPFQGESPNLTVTVDYFFNNNLEYLKSSNPTKSYATSIMKTKAARYEIKGIEDMVPTLWSTVKHGYNKDAKKGIKYWGERQKPWYKSWLKKFSKTNVYSIQKILSMVNVKLERLHGYGHLEEIVVKRSNRHKYKFKEGDFVDLHLNDIEDMLLLVVQYRLFHLNEKDIVDFIVVVRMFIRSLIIKRRIEDLQLGVESYQKKLNIITPQKTFPGIEFKELYTPSGDPAGIVYEDLDKQLRLMRANELYKFSDGILQAVRDEIHHRIRDFSLGFNKEMPLRKWSKVDVKRSKLMVKLIDKQLLERRIIKNLERLVGAQELKMDYRLMQRTV